MATKYYCSRYKREVELYGNHCLGCSLFPFNVGECPSRINLDNRQLWQQLNHTNMDKEELKTILSTACYNVDKLERVGIKLNDSEKNIVKGVLYSLYYAIY